MVEINYDKYLDLLKSNNTEKIEKVTKINFSNTNLNSIGLKKSSSKKTDLSKSKSTKNVETIQSLTGLPDLSMFKNLRELDCSNNKLIELPDLSMFKNLKVLNCSYNELKSIRSLNNSLQEFYCAHNNLTKLPEFTENLKIVSCTHNEITVLPHLNNKLEKFACDNNPITELPELTVNLSRLSCQENLLTSLPSNLPKTLLYLLCKKNQIEVIPSLNEKLYHLDCGFNKIQYLPSLNRDLKYLDCNDNELVALPTLNDNLTHLNCENNYITDFPNLPNNLSTLMFYGNPIYTTLIGYNKTKILGQDKISEINVAMIPIHNIRNKYFSLKNKDKLRDLLWKGVKEPKIKKLYHPEVFEKELEDETADVSDLLQKLEISETNPFTYEKASEQHVEEPVISKKASTRSKRTSNSSAKISLGDIKAPLRLTRIPHSILNKLKKNNSSDEKKTKKQTKPKKGGKTKKARKINKSKK
jgi:Leucine-rich repeat (LRR) protein